MYLNGVKQQLSDVPRVPALDLPVDELSQQMQVSHDGEGHRQDGFLLVLHDDVEALEVEELERHRANFVVDGVKAGDEQVDEQDVGHQQVSSHDNGRHPPKKTKDWFPPTTAEVLDLHVIYCIPYIASLGKWNDAEFHAWLLC